MASTYGWRGESRRGAGFAVAGFDSELREEFSFAAAHDPFFGGGEVVVAAQVEQAVDEVER